MIIPRSGHKTYKMGRVCGCKGLRLDIALCVLFQMNLSVIAVQGLFGHASNLPNHVLSEEHHQLNQIVNSKTNPSPSCEFKRSLCSYTLIRDNRSPNVTWLTDNLNNTHLPKGNYAILVGPGEEGARSHLQSQNFQTAANDRVEFFYFLSGVEPGQLQLTFVQNNNKIDETVWSDSEDHGSVLNYGCMELPPRQTGHLLFTGILGPTTGSFLAVQKVIISKGICEHNVQRSTCTFDNSLLCNYTLNCSTVSEYTWRRYKGATPTVGTGPNGDLVKPFDGFYLYAESSYGRQGDSTSVTFPVGNTTGKYLHFWYHMYGKSIGSLHLRYHSGQVRREEWTVSGEQGIKWRYFCQQILTDIDAFSLIAVRGSSYFGDIAIDNVRIDDKECQNGSLDCNFNCAFICGYNITSGWVRKTSPSGNFMHAEKYGVIHLMQTPSIEVLDSCVRIHYKMSGFDCKLLIYKNQQVLFSLDPKVPNVEYTAQFYVKQERMELQFKIEILMICQVDINRVSVVKGNCPAIDCPRKTKACQDGQFCVDKKQICDGRRHCDDGSDEICPKSIACDFEYKNNCGYNVNTNGHSEKVEGGAGNDSDYYQLIFGDSNWTSPQQQINESCVQFSFRGRLEASVELLLSYRRKKSTSVWNYSFPKTETPWSIGQFFISAGYVQLVFHVKGVFRSEFKLDNIRLIPGSCPPIDCGDDEFPCAQNDKCIPKTSICDRQNDCSDKSDESNCSLSIDCEFEDLFLCGYAFGKGWIVTTGKDNISPRHDKTKGNFYGHYMAQRIVDMPLYTPEITLKTVTCVRFYYYLRRGGVFHVYDNNVTLLEIKSNGIDRWSMVQLQLNAGKHQLGFKQTEILYRTTLAIDSISTISGRCQRMECADKWTKCSSADLCFPNFRFCDGEIDCPNGEDENNCTVDSTIRLIMGQDVNQGYVEYRLNGTWNKICYKNEINPSSNANAKVVCQELGYRGKARDTFRTSNPVYVVTSIKHIQCLGTENSISECPMEYCSNCYCKHYFSADCSNHHCLSDQVPCPGENGKPYTVSSRCIWKYNLCDGEYDCPVGTDELNCKQCNLSEFRCRDKECISQSLRCNGVADCRDSSDEHDCFIQNGTSVLMMQHDRYGVLCENNINNQQIADGLCKAMGRGNGTILQSSKSGQGILFIASSNSKGGILPGYHSPGVKSCQLLNLFCNLKGCGVPGYMSGFEPNIRYGIFALPGEWPWQVALYRDSNFICGGTLIGKRHVLTAAHCVTKKTSYYSVRVGSVNKKSGHWVQVKNITSHPRYEETYHRYDFAILELNFPLKIDNFTQIACLPSKPVTINSLCYSTGWGRDEKGKYPENLKEVKAHILPTGLCMKYYPNSAGVAICANHPMPHQPACFGDSGGPLQCRNQYGHWDIIGVTSFGRPQCLGIEHSPEAYADVYAHIDWIIQNTPNLYQ